MLKPNYHIPADYKYRIGAAMQLIGNNIKQLRENKHITQEDLAYYAETSVATISRLENGLIQIRLDTLVKLALALRVPMAVLVQEIDNSNSTST